MSHFKQPEYVWIAAGALAFVGVMTLLPIGHIEKFGFLIAMGAGVYMLSVSAKAAMSGQKPLAVVLFYTGLLMLGMGALGTPKEILAANALEDFAPAIVGGMGIFSKVDAE